ncbi:MAG TPA: hypothetical protein VMT87_14630, partial [Vicinamibacteria bacterium]|nr:hypothetical protein [Vicinamibacteria bacterium]
LAAATVAGLLFLFHPGVRADQGSLYDEGNTVCSGWRVAAGDVLYRDLGPSAATSRQAVSATSALLAAS